MTEQKGSRIPDTGTELDHWVNLLSAMIDRE